MLRTVNGTVSFAIFLTIFLPVHQAVGPTPKTAQTPYISNNELGLDGTTG